MKLNKKESNKIIKKMQKTQKRKPNKIEKKITSYIKSEEVEIVPVKSDVLFPRNKNESPIETVKINFGAEPQKKRKKRRNKSKKLGNGKYPKIPLYPKNTKIIATKKKKLVPKTKSARLLRGKHGKKSKL